MAKPKKKKVDRPKIEVFTRVMTKDGAKAMVIWDMDGEVFCAMGENTVEAVRSALQLTEDLVDDVNRLLNVVEDLLKEFK